MIESIMDFVIFVYVYCTDFIINVANIFELSYYEMNALIFCLILPLLTVVLICIYVFQMIRLKRLKNTIAKS